MMILNNRPTLKGYYKMTYSDRGEHASSKDRFEERWDSFHQRLRRDLQDRSSRMTRMRRKMGTKRPPPSFYDGDASYYYYSPISHCDVY